MIHPLQLTQQEVEQLTYTQAKSALKTLQGMIDMNKLYQDLTQDERTLLDPWINQVLLLEDHIARFDNNRFQTFIKDTDTEDMSDEEVELAFARAEAEARRAEAEVDKPKRVRARRNQGYRTPQGQFNSIAEASRITGIAKQTLQNYASQKRPGYGYTDPA